MMTETEKALRQFRKAQSRHLSQQAIGLTDKSPRQTRRMALAVKSLQRSHFNYHSALMTEKLHKRLGY